jgi:hypothetical protein
MGPGIREDKRHHKGNLAERSKAPASGAGP